MPNQQAHIAAISADGHQIAGWLFLFSRGDAVAVYDVDTTPTFPAYDLDVTLTSGASANVKQGALYTVETAGGVYKGMGRIRYAGTISNGNLPVRELSRGSIDVAATDVVRVYRYFLPGDKLVGATVDFNPDGLSYTDQGANPPPIGNNGGGWAGFSSQLPFALNDSDGYVVDPDSSSPVTVVRTLPTGLSYDTGDDTTLDVTVEGDPGTYWIETVVTDPDNGKSVTRYTPVCISDDPLDCTVDPYGGDMDNGWHMTVNFREEVAIEEGTIAAFVARETIGGVEGSFGSASEDRSHIKFFGIVRRLSAEGDGTGVNTVSYELISPLAWLLETPGFSKVMLDVAAPANWMQMKTLDTKRAKLQIIQFYTNLNQVGHDLAFTSNYRIKRYPGFFLEKNTPVAQLRELADGVGARFTCNRQGRFEFFTRPRFEPLADRAAIVTMLTPTADGIIRYNITQELKPTIEKSYFLGFVAGASGNAPFRISFPGKAPGTGVQSPQFDKMICDSITDAEEEAGRRGALVEQVYVTSTGERLWGIAVELTLYGSFDVFDLYGEWVGLPALTNVAGIDTSAYRYEIESIGVEYSDGTGRITLRLLSETNAPPGQYDPPPPDAVAPDLDHPFYIGLPVPISSGSRLPPWNGVNIAPTALFVLAANDNLAHYASAWDIATASPIYTDITGSLGGTGNIWSCSDSYNYARKLALQNDGGVYDNPNVTNGSTFSLLADATAVFGNSAGRGSSIMGSINRRNFYIIPTGNFCAVITFDNFATFTRVEVFGGSYTHGTAIGANTMSVAVSSRNSLSSGRIYAVVGLPFGGSVALCRSENWGLTWSVVASGATLGFDGNITGTPRVHVPYTRLDGSPNLNNSSQEVWLVDGGIGGAGVNRGQVNFSSNAGATWTAVHVVNSGTGSVQKPYSVVAGYSLMTFTHDSSVVFWAGQNGFEFSTDGGVTQDFSSNVLPNAAAGNIHMNGYSNHIGAVLAWNRAGTGAHFLASLDGGTTRTSIALPSGVTFVSYSEFDLSVLIPPA